MRLEQQLEQPAIKRAIRGALKAKRTLATIVRKDNGKGYTEALKSLQSALRALQALLPGVIVACNHDTGSTHISFMTKMGEYTRAFTSRNGLEFDSRPLAESARIRRAA